VSALRVFLAVMVIGLDVAGAIALAGHRVAVVSSVDWIPKTGGYSVPGEGTGTGGFTFATQADCLPVAQAADGSDACAEQRITHPHRPSWIIPAAILVGVLGLGAAGAISRPRAATT